MMNYQKNIKISTIYLFSSLFIISASPDSFLRQFTDDLNTNLQPSRKAEPNMESNQDYGVSSSQEFNTGSLRSTVTGLRYPPPSSYSLKFESFNTLLKSSTDRYQSRPFTVAGYNWTFIVYPNGNKAHKGGGYISLYVQIDNSTFQSKPQTVYADVRFYIFNQFERKYFTVQDTDVLPFDASKTMWGFPQVLPVSTFTDYNKGYLFNGGECEFGVDVFVPTSYQKWELFTVTNTFPNPKFTWTIQKFSTLYKDSELSDDFIIGGRRWNIQVYPNGKDRAQGKYLSMFLNFSPNEKLRPYERVYVRAKLRIVNQRGSQNVDCQIDNWFNGYGYGDGYGWGLLEFTSLSNLRDSSKGLLVNDTLIVQVEIESLSTTKYFPV